MPFLLSVVVTGGIRMLIAYVTEPHAVIRRSGRTLVVERDGKRLAEWELTRLQSIVLCGNVHLTSPAVKLLLRHGIETAYLGRSGELLGQLTPPKPANIELRMKQYGAHQDSGQRLVLARETVRQKIGSQQKVMERYAANYSDDNLFKARRQLVDSLLQVENAVSLAQLRGIEGFAARCYWSGFRSQVRGELVFGGRSIRPPRDEINALLSLGYTFLCNELSALLDAVGFDPWLGFYHDRKNHRPALALDLMEPLRHDLVDRMVLKMVNRKQVQASDFSGSEANGFRLSRDGWKTFIHAWETMMQTISGSEPNRQSQRQQLQNVAANFRLQLMGSAEAIVAAAVDLPTTATNSETLLEEQDDE
jgi:CRISPR-associated protein Cas1